MATIKKQLTLTFKQPNIAESYGPYASVLAAHEALSEDQLNVIGMTVGVEDSTTHTIEEYWYQGGTEQANLMKKQSLKVEANPEDPEGEYPSAIELLTLKIDELVYMIPESEEPDAQLSSTSTNSVLNKVVKAALDGKAPSSNILKNALANDVQTSLGNADTAVQSSEKGTINGVATLGSDGKVPQSQLPSYVDDVLEYSNQSSFPATGESGKIYVALDTNKTYRWGGSVYVEISQSLALGETSSTAFAGDRGKAIEDKIPSNASSSNKLATASDVNSKLNAPATAGTSGQVLTSDGNGGQSWQTPTSGVSSYSNLNDKPQINNVTLSGNKTASDLGLATAEQGTKADTAVQQVTVGTTTTGAAGSNASVTNSGTSTAPVFDFTIPRGSDAVNPFKGYFNSLSDLQAKYPTGETGDFANVYDSTANKTYRYIWDASLATPAWAQALDSSSNPIEVTPSTATFNSGESVVDVSIVDFETGGVSNVPNAESVKQLNEKLYGVPSGQVEEVENDLAMTVANKRHINLGPTTILIYADVSTQPYHVYEFDVRGLSKVRIYPNPSLSIGLAWFAVMKKRLPVNPASGENIRVTFGTDTAEYMATGCDGYNPSNSFRMAVNMTDEDVVRTGYHEVELSDNAQYVYVAYNYINNSVATDCYPSRVTNVDEIPIPEEVGDIDKLESRIGALEEDDEGTMLSEPTPPCPPRLFNIKFNEDGSYEENNSVLTTSAIYGDFYCCVDYKKYRIKRVMRVDENNKIINYHLVTNTGDGQDTTLPYGALDTKASAYAFGTAWAHDNHGVMIEIQDINNTTSNPIPISPNDNIFVDFKYKNYLLTSELSTSSKFNAASADDINLSYTKDSVISLIKRARICSMVEWTAKKDIVCTQASWRNYQYKAGSHQTGVPYSRANVRERWFGLNCSPLTFVTASLNPYSVLYTEQIGDGIDYPFKSEYGITSYGSGHGVPYYGLVCSSYASYIIGASAAVQTSNIPLDTNKFKKVKTISYGGTKLSASELEPMSFITTPSHSYIVVDFLLNEFGDRVFAIVTETTCPNCITKMYELNRLNNRFSVEFSKLTSGESIYVSMVKPSYLDEHKNVNIWSTKYLYDILQIGRIHPVNTSFKKVSDDNIMFYMGNQAVVMKYDTTNYVKNDAYWLIIKPENIYTTVQVEKYNNTTSQWSIVGSKTISTDKQSYSDNNTTYYKIDVTSLCETKGRYRACLIDNSTNKTGYTEWIVLDVTLYKDNTGVKWTVNNEGSSEGDSDYATVVAANIVNSVGQPYGGDDTVEETNVSRGYIGYMNESSLSARVVVKCAFGTASRYKVMTTFS